MLEGEPEKHRKGQRGSERGINVDKDATRKTHPLPATEWPGQHGRPEQRVSAGLHTKVCLQQDAYQIMDPVVSMAQEPCPHLQQELQTLPTKDIVEPLDETSSEGTRPKADGPDFDERIKIDLCDATVLNVSVTKRYKCSVLVEGHLNFLHSTNCQIYFDNLKEHALAMKIPDKAVEVFYRKPIRAYKRKRWKIKHFRL